MKKLLLLLALVPGALFGMQESVRNLNDFITMKNSHKKDWLDNKQANFNAKIEMIKKHKDEWFELKIRYMNQLGQGVPGQTYLTNKLNDMVRLYETQNEEWAQLAEAQHQKKLDIAKGHKVELDELKKNIIQEPPVQEEEVEEAAAEPELLN